MLLMPVYTRRTPETIVGYVDSNTGQHIAQATIAAIAYIGSCIMAYCLRVTHDRSRAYMTMTLFVLGDGMPFID